MSFVKIDLNDPVVLVPAIIAAYVLIMSVLLYIYSKLSTDKRRLLFVVLAKFLSVFSSLSSMFLLDVTEKNNKNSSRNSRGNISSREYMGRRYIAGSKKIITKQERSPSLIALVDKEFSNANLVRNVFINVFVIFTLCIMGTYLWLDKISLETKIVVGVSYLSFSLFNIFIIKSSYRRTAMLLSIMEDSKKQSDIGDFINKHRHGKGLSDNDIEFIRLMYVSRAERERAVEHPYELFLKNVNGATINFGKGSIKVDAEKEKK